MEEGPIRVLIVDDVAETRANIREWIEPEEDIEVVGEAWTGVEAIEKYVELRPDVVSMNVNMPDMDGITATRIIGEIYNDAKIFMLSVQSEAEYMRRAMDAGAKDYLSKPPHKEELVATIRQTAGRTMESEELLDALEKEWEENEELQKQRLGGYIIELDSIAKKYFKGNLTILRTSNGWKVWLGPPSPQNLKMAKEGNPYVQRLPSEPRYGPPNPSIKDELEACIVDVAMAVDGYDILGN